MSGERYRLTCASSLTKATRPNDAISWVIINALFFKLFNATFNNISAILWLSVLLVKETGAPGENHRPAASRRQTLSHNVVHLGLFEIRTHDISGDMHRLHR